MDTADDDLVEYRPSDGDASSQYASDSSETFQWGIDDDETFQWGADDDEAIEDAWDPEALFHAEWRRETDTVRRLIKKGHLVHETHEESGITFLFKAASCNYDDLIVELLRNGAEVDARNKKGQTALFDAAGDGCLEAIQELIKHGAAVDATCKNGETPLLYAAYTYNLDVIRELIKSGADVHATTMDGRGALRCAADGRPDNTTMIEELISSGANPLARAKDGKSALSIAAEKGHSEVVEMLLLATVLDKSACSKKQLELFKAAALGDFNYVEKLIKEGESVDTTTTDGRTPLFYAAEIGHKDVVRTLLKLGTSVSKQSIPTNSSLGGETPLTLAGRAGHMEMFESLIKAGAPVNVRSRDTGETPLISAARWDFTAGEQLLLSSGGALRDDDVREVDGCPLIPGSLETMKPLCVETLEFESMCGHVVGRLQDVCSQLQALDPANFQANALVTFTSILFRFCRLQLGIEKRLTPLSRFIGSRVIASKIFDFHEELDHFADLLGLVASPTGANAAWKAQWSEDRSLLAKQFEAKLADDKTLMSSFELDQQKLYAAILLQSELVAHAREGNASLQKIVRNVRDHFLKLNELEAPVLPAWFISREDVEIQRWKIALPSNYNKFSYYEGEWRKTSVRIVTCHYPVDKSVSRWFELSHPNVIKLFGACNTGDSFFVVYEMVPGSRELLDFLHKDNELNCDGAMWKCLYQAALGLRCIHNRGLVHGQLRPENIFIGSNLVTQLTGLYRDSEDLIVSYATDGRTHAKWKAGELYNAGTLPSAASDIYAFGMCIWEALTLELPWKGLEDGEIEEAVREGKFPDRPSVMTDDEWDLITKMCKRDLAERVDINFVVNRLEKFVYDSSKVDSTISAIQSESVDEHLFVELDFLSIPEALKSVAFKCEQLPEEDQWMSKSVFPALEFIFELLQQQQKTASDIEAVQFCLALSRFQRHLRIARSKNSTRRYARSRKVAESNSVVYTELDRLLDVLEVSAENPIRRWKHGSVSSRQDGVDGATPTFNGLSEGAIGNVSVGYFDSPSTNHHLWTRAGLKAFMTTQPWALPLKEVLFKESDRIGKGAFGEVFKGSWLGTPVVVKFMGYEEDQKTIPTDLLLHEVRVWHRLNHPHVLRFYGACHQDKRYFVCEFASGGDLLDFLKKPSNEKLTWQKLYESALGLQYLHGQNVAHNDLKCDNIMVGMDGNAKLIDFGLSCLLNEAEIRIEKKAIGAVHWRSPEYLAGGRPSFASDVYSFAMCIIEVISGDIPWGKNMHAAGVKFQVRKGNIPNLPASMNDKQRNLIKLMTKAEPSERVRMGFVVDKLSEIAREESSGDAAP